MDLDDDFKYAVDRSQLLEKQPTNILLDLYSLYKQASEGDVQGKRPGMTNMRGRAKWDAWEKRKGMARDEAKRQYIALVDKLEES